MSTVLLREPIEEAAAKLRETIRADGEAGCRSLIRFAERFAPDRGLQDEALILNLDVQSREPEDRAELEARMLELVDRIAQNFAREGGEEALRRRERADRKAEEHLRQAAPPSEPAFVAKGIVKGYPGGDFRLGAVDLTLRVGEITGIVGQNAHGKTTLLRIIAGELRQDQGTLSYPLFGEGGSGAIDWVLVKSSLAYVPQELAPWRGSLLETLHYEAALHGVLGRDNERQVAFVVERLRLGEHLDKRWGGLSGGYKLRFALARALVWKPRLLILDEPLANLDVKAKSVLLQDLRDLARSYRYPIAVVLSSHELYSLEAVCQQMIFLRDGKVVYAGPTQAIGSGLKGNEYQIETVLGIGEVRRRLAHPSIEEIREAGIGVRVRTARGLGPGEFLRLLVDCGVDVRSFRDVSGSILRLFE